MKRPSFIEGAAFALVAAVAGGIAFTLLVPLLAGGAALRVVVAALALAYVIYLLARSRARAGRVSAVAAWALTTALAWWFAPSLTLYLLAEVGFLWLLRTLLFHRGAFAALADLGLSAAALGAAGWALTRTGSVGAALWCFFLVVALFVAIPARVPKRAPQGDEPVTDDRFQQAHRVAEAALRELSVRH